MFSWFKKKAKIEADAPPSAEELQEFLAQIPAHAEQHRQTAKEIFGIDLDYSAQSIALLDRMIDEGWQQPPVFLDPVVLLFGSYLGETIRRLHGAHWKYEEDFGYYLDEVGGKNIKIFPLSKVRKRFLNGSEDSLAFYYSVIEQQILKNDESP